MARKLSVLYVGTSAARGSAARRAFAERGYDVLFDMPFASEQHKLSPSGGPFDRHDLIAFDTAGDEARDAGVLVINGRADMNPSARHLMQISDLDRLPDDVVEMLDSFDTGSAAQAGDGALRELQELIAGLPGVVLRCQLDREGQVNFLSEQVAELCGYRQSHFVGRRNTRLLALVHPSDRRRVVTAIQHSMSNGKPFALEHRVVCRGGKEKWLWHRGCVNERPETAPEVESFVVDITERKYEEQHLAYLANHDALTGVANRGMFMEQVGKSIQRADRHGEMIACLFLDLDRFKRVNDSFGHSFGDELLQQVSERLKRCIRGNDLIGRLGGDEFTVLLDGIAESQDAAAAAKKILEELVRPYTIRDRSFSISASIGISCYPGDAKDRTSLLRNADAAMYNVKSSGRRGYRFYSAEMSNQAYETLALTNGLRDAIESESLRLCYQPRVDLRTGRIGGVEVLARWHSPEFGRVSPSRFIPLAEDVGLVEQLGDWVLREACRQALEWDREGLRPARISVNLSPRQFRDEHLCERILAVLRESGLPPSRLELEITETTIMQDHVAAAETLRQLKSLDVKLSIDDFGTGYSSLHLLKKFPLDFLKVDQSFINGVPDDEDDVAITEAIITMAKRLNLGVVAEGIETEAQAIFVRSSGCDEGQGYLFSRPVPGSGISRFLMRRVH